MNDKGINNLAEEILQEFTNCYSDEDKDCLVKMINKYLPKDSVVLSKGEYQKYCAYKIIEPQIKGCFDRDREFEKRLETIRKETAEKILAMFDDKNHITENDLKIAIAKQFGVEL